MIRRYFTEMLGTFFLTLAVGMAGTPIGLGVMLMVMVYIGGHISGAHYNPAVTLCLWWSGKHASKEVLGYIVFQLIGAFIAAGVYYLITDRSFAPSPVKGVTPIQAVLAEAVFTFVLCVLVYTVSISKHLKGNHIYGIAIGGAVMAGAFAVGGVSSAAFNPAIGTMPAMVGAGLGQQSPDMIWIYWAGPLIGALIASYVCRYLHSQEN